LLLSGWKVTFNSEAVAATDTPATVLRWLLQQLRWTRATHIETFQYPALYVINGPIVLIQAMRRVSGPIRLCVPIFAYVLTGRVLYPVSLYDVAFRMLLCASYAFICHRGKVGNIFYLIIAQIFYQVPLPAITIWGGITALEGGWGTQAKNQLAGQKRRHAGWDNIWAMVVIMAWMALFTAAFAKRVVYSLGLGQELELMIISASVVNIFLYYLIFR
jgi:hyaluronan synthase